MKNPFRRRAEQRNLTAPWDVGPSASSGIPMTPERALTLAPVYAAGRLLGSWLASMPIQQYRRVGETRQKLPLSSLFLQPSAQGVRYDWIFRAVTSMAYQGNAVGYITAWDSYQYPTSIEWLNPAEVSVVDSQPSGPGSFVQPLWYWRGRPVSAENLVHIPWFVLPGRVWGLSPIGAYAMTVATGLAAQKFSADWFAGGGAPPGTFKNETQTLDQTEATVMKKRFGQAMRSHEPIVFGRDWTYTPISVSANEARFVETMRLGATEIAGIYGIPPELIGGETGGTMSYSSPEQRQIELVQFSLMQWTAKFEAHFEVLLPRPQYVKFNVDAQIRPDIATRYSSYQTARMIGMLNVDEIRALEDLPPLPNGAGQDYTPLAIKPGTGAAPQIRSETERLRLVAGDD